jgi:hypothetical protein
MVYKTHLGIVRILPANFFKKRLSAFFCCRHFFLIRGSNLGKIPYRMEEGGWRREDGGGRIEEGGWRREDT